MTTKKIDEKFDASFGVNASIPDPITTKDNSRPADKSEGEKAMPTLPKSQMISDMVTKAYSLDSASLAPGYAEFMKIAASGGGTAEGNRATIKAGGMKEDMDLVFDGSDLSEEFRNRATTIFEAAVNSKVLAEVARLEEEAEIKLEEALAERSEEMQDQVDKYLDYVVEQWVEDNKLAIETGIRADILENFMSGLKTLFTEHYIDIPEDKVDVVESLTAKVEELTSSLNEAQNSVVEANRKLQEATAATIVSEVAEGMTATGAEALKSLVESVEFTDEESYRAKVKTIAEGYVSKKGTVVAVDQLNEEVELESDKTSPFINDPVVAAVARHIKQSAKN